MRLAAVLVFVALVPAAHAQACHANNAATALQGIAAGLQLSVASSQLSVALHQLSRTECRQDADCNGRYRCSAQQCVAVGDGPSQHEQQAAIFLRARAVELREELALGKGPVIDGLAGAQGKPPAELGKVLKANRVALRALIGDGSDPAWSTRFLAHLDTLS